MNARTHGFTLIEMCIGMALTALIASAVATFSLAVSQNWQNEQRGQRLGIGAEVIAARIRSVVQSAKLVGGGEPGSLVNGGSAAGVLLWVADTNSDGLIQGNETAMLYFDPTAQQLCLYAGNVSETSTWPYTSAFMSAASVDAYRSGRSSTLFANNIAACCFDSSGNSADGTSQISMAFQMLATEGGRAETITHYVAAALRAPAAIPGN